MDLKKEFQNIAHTAATAVEQTMSDYARGNAHDEDDITGLLVGSLRANIESQKSAISWDAKILRHRRGTAAEEAKTGADLLIHIKLSSPDLTYSKGLLVQAKKNEPKHSMQIGEHGRLLTQCDQMLSITPAAFVFNYSKSGMRCASAMKVKGASSLDLHATCDLTPYRFFLEFFRCTTGDQNIVSNRFDELKIPHGVEIVGKASQ